MNGDEDYTIVMDFQQSKNATFFK